MNAPQLRPYIKSDTIIPDTRKRVKVLPQPVKKIKINRNDIIRAYIRDNPEATYKEVGAVFFITPEKVNKIMNIGSVGDPFLRGGFEVQRTDLELLEYFTAYKCRLLDYYNNYNWGRNSTYGITTRLMVRMASEINEVNSILQRLEAGV